MSDRTALSEQVKQAMDALLLVIRSTGTRITAEQEASALAFVRSLLK